MRGEIAKWGSGKTKLGTTKPDPICFSFGVVVVVAVVVVAVVPNQQRTLNKLPTGLRCRNFVNNYKSAPKAQKMCMQCVLPYICQLSFHFAVTVGGWVAVARVSVWVCPGWVGSVGSECPWQMGLTFFFFLSLSPLFHMNITTN